MENERGIQVSASSSSCSSDAVQMGLQYYLKEAEKHFLEFGTAPPRPPHIKGKQIGMWHAKMGRLRQTMSKQGLLKPTKEKAPPNKPLGDVKLSTFQKYEIKAVLDNLPDKMGGSYQNIEESQFKQEYLQNIHGRLEDHMEDNEEYEQNSVIDEKLYKELQSKIENRQFIEMSWKRNLLPSTRVKDKIINMIITNQVVLISGETGCGKTTQVPQFILDHFIENKKGSMCKVVCTQPRRISAISVAERVAVERVETLGQSAGYQIRLEKKLPRDRGSLTFCTTGVVLRQMQSDPCLSEYSHIIIDEIHERNIETDFLITLLKQVIVKRADLRLILMSATLNAESFSKYFDNCPHLKIPGFTHHVEEYFLEDVLMRTKYQFKDNSKMNYQKRTMDENQEEFYNTIIPYVQKLKRENKYDSHVWEQLRNQNSEILDIRLVFKLLVDICEKETDKGAVLIFLPGLSDISELHKSIESSRQFPRQRFLVIPLHSMLPTAEQKQIFETPPPGVRKIIIATNIAETSITIDDVVFVIDCGKIKIKYYDIKTNTETLEAKWVSRANASQRKGRAGRVKPGVCFHLMSRRRYEALEPFMLPEILRTRLENVILIEKILQLGKVEEFFGKLMDSPDPDVVTKSIELLKQLEALNEHELLTPLGYHLAKLPMNPQIGKMLLFGSLFNCLDPILNIAVTLDFKDPFLIPLGREKEADRKRKAFAECCGSDHLYMDKVMRTFENLSDTQRRKFCWEYFLSWSTMTQLIKLKRDFIGNLHDLRFAPNNNPKCLECNVNSNKVDLIRAVICAGLYPNVVKVRTRGRRKFSSALSLVNGHKVDLHPKSILKGEYINKPLMVYCRMVKSSVMFIHDATPIDPFHAIFFGDNFQEVTDNDHHFITINNSLKFKSLPSTSKIIKELRNKLNNFLEYKISHPNVVDLRKENEESLLLRTIIDLLHSEAIDHCELDGFEEKMIE